MAIELAGQPGGFRHGQLLGEPLFSTAYLQQKYDMQQPSNKSKSRAPGNHEAHPDFVTMGQIFTGGSIMYYWRLPESGIIGGIIGETM